MSPTIESEEVLGFHDNRFAPSPPSSGWLISQGLAADPNFRITRMAKDGGTSEEAELYQEVRDFIRNPILDQVVKPKKKYKKD